MNRFDPPDAIFTVNDFTATGVIKALHEMKIRIPEEVSVIGFSNGLITQVTHPTLSTVDQHGYQMGQVSVQLLLDRLINNHSDHPYIHQVLKTELIIRESTRRN